MLQLIEPVYYRYFSSDLDAMFQLRRRVFKDRLQWNVSVSNGRETDEFDELAPSYLLLRSAGDVVIGCVRLLPSTGPTMLSDKFPELLDGQPGPKNLRIWESSRFALDLEPASSTGRQSVRAETSELFAGMIEFGLAHDLTNIVTVTDVRMERILRRAGWPLARLGTPRQIGNTEAVAGLLEISHQSWVRVCEYGGVSGPVLWAPISRQFYPSNVRDRSGSSGISEHE